jgi:tetratricopeptide (TPR) repeat protein
MSAPVRELDDYGPSQDEPLSYAPKKARRSQPNPDATTASKKTAPPKKEGDAPRKIDAARQRWPSEPPEPSWQQKRRPAFASDMVGPPTRLALAPDRLPAPPSPVPTVSKFGAAAWLMGTIVVAAAGGVGYLWGSTPKAIPLQQVLAPSANQADQTTERSISAAYVTTQGLAPKPPAVQPAASDLAGNARSVRTGAVSMSEAASQSPARAQSVSSRAPHRGDARVVAHREPAPSPLSNDTKFYKERGLASYRSGDFRGAIAEFDQAIRLNSNDAEAYNIRGNALDETGAYERALADYDEAIRIDPNNPAVFRDRAILWRRKGELDKALVDLDRAIRFSFSDANIYSDRGLVWYEKGRRDRAIADFSQAIKIDPNFAAYINRGLILHRNSESNPVIAAAEKAIRIDPKIFGVIQRADAHP